MLFPLQKTLHPSVFLLLLLIIKNLSANPNVMEAVFLKTPMKYINFIYKSVMRFEETAVKK